MEKAVLRKLFPLKENGSQQKYTIKKHIGENILNGFKS